MSLADYRRRPGNGNATVDRARLTVGFVLANHFTLTAFSAFIDTLRLASDEGDRSRQINCRWSVMSATGQPVLASCGVNVVANSKLLDPRQFNYVVVVGGLLHHGPQVDAETESYLRTAAEAGVTLVGVCTGSFVLARAGLLKGRKCCVSWYHRRDLIEEFDDLTPVSDQLFAIDGDRITCSGGAGVADLAATLVDRHLGESVARKSLSVLLFESPRGERATQPMPTLAQGVVDERVRRAILLMEQSLSDPISVASIARRLGVSERQLDRLFHKQMGNGPYGVNLAMRLEYGRWLLSHTARDVAEIAAMTGFVDGAHFARAFRKRYSCAPSDLRASLEQSRPQRTASRADELPDRRLFS